MEYAVGRKPSIIKSNYFEVIGIIVFATSEPLINYITKKYPDDVYGIIFSYAKNKSDVYVKDLHSTLYHNVLLAIRNMDEKALYKLIGNWDNRYGSKAYTLFLENLLKLLSERIDMDVVKFTIDPNFVEKTDDIDLQTAPSVWPEMQQIVIENILWGAKTFQKNVRGLLHKPAIVGKLPWFRNISAKSLQEIEYLISAYEVYLKELKLGKLKSNICVNIEYDPRFKGKIKDIRQDFARYDNYFVGMENKINNELKPSKSQEHIHVDNDNQIKVIFFKSCLKFLRKMHKSKSLDNVIANL